MAKKIGKLIVSGKDNSQPKLALTVMYDGNRGYPYYILETPHQAVALNILKEVVDAYYFYKIIDKVVFGLKGTT